MSPESPPPRPLRQFDVERVRLEAERELFERLELRPEPADQALQQRRARNHVARRAVRLTPSMAPTLFEVAHQVQTVFGIATPLELYQVDAETDNAFAHALGGTASFTVELAGKILIRLDPGSLRALIGHEVGHHLAHAPRSPWSRTRDRVLCGDEQLDIAVGQRYIMSGELTADRIGLLACQSLDDALRLEMILVAGLPASALSWDTKAYLDQCREQVEKALRGEQQIRIDIHVESSFRVYAHWLFSETDVYRALTGSGPGTRKLGEVDRILSRLLGVHEPSAGPVRPVRQPAPPEPARPEMGFFETLRAGWRATFSREEEPRPDTEPVPSDEELFADRDEERLNKQFEELERQLKEKGKG